MEAKSVLVRGSWSPGVARHGIVENSMLSEESDSDLHARITRMPNTPHIA
jgi:hypothetical protein